MIACMQILSSPSVVDAPEAHASAGARDGLPCLLSASWNRVSEIYVFSGFQFHSHLRSQLATTDGNGREDNFDDSTLRARRTDPLQQNQGDAARGRGTRQ